MSTFTRDFPVSRLKEALHGSPWIVDLLSRWQPAGAGSAYANDGNLRLAVRDRYLNFYKRGQSVARLNFDQKRKLQSRIHRKFIYGKEATAGPDYVVLNSAGYVDQSGQRRPYAGTTELNSWIDAAKARAGVEKTFVDRIVDNNENVVDLEMTLSAVPEDEDKPRALRMDLIALEPDEGSFKVVFWEVKLADDKRSKRRGDVAPQVFRQIDNYAKWLDRHENRAHVVTAYTETCKIMVEMHEVARSINPAIHNLGKAIVAIESGAATLTVDPKPRLLIYDPRPESKFTAHNHLEKLQKLGHHVQLVPHEGNVILDMR